MLKLIIFLILIATQLNAQNEKVSLQLIWKHQFQFAGFYMAKELGYYNDAGIDVEIIERNGRHNPVELIENKKVDFAIGRSSLLIAKGNSKDVVALAALFQHSPLTLIVRKNAGINSLGDLKGKKVMIPSDLQNSVSIKYMLNENNITLQDLELVSDNYTLKQFINGELDAFTGYISNEPFVLKEKNIDYKSYNLKDYGFDFYSDILFTSSKFINENPELTQKFYEASRRGWEYAFNNIAKTALTIYKNYNTQNKSLINLVKEGEELKKIAYDEFGILLHLDREKLQNTIDIFKILGFAHKDINLDDFIYNHHSDDIYRIKIEHDDIFHYSLLLLLLFILLLMAVIYFFVHKKWLLTKNRLQEEIKAKEKEIKKQNALILQQAKMTAMGDMLSNISHQWRQPLNNISLNISNLEISTELKERVDKDELFECVNFTSKQIQYLSETIDVFRNFVISDTKNITEIKLQKIISDTKSLVMDSFKHEKITIIESVQDCTLLLNSSNLTQVIMNILNNAKDALNSFKPDARYVFISSSVRSNKVIISIKDSAGGIDSDILKKIFEPYFSTKLDSRGTGIGLYIVHELITKSLNGTIEARNSIYIYKSEQYTGAEFIITLPLSLLEKK